VELERRYKRPSRRAKGKGAALSLHCPIISGQGEIMKVEVRMFEMKRVIQDAGMSPWE
jgi:hypothetical protein